MLSGDLSRHEGGNVEFFDRLHHEPRDFGRLADTRAQLQSESGTLHYDFLHAVHGLVVVDLFDRTRRLQEVKSDSFRLLDLEQQLSLHFGGTVLLLLAPISLGVHELHREFFRRVNPLDYQSFDKVFLVEGHLIESLRQPRLRHPDLRLVVRLQDSVKIDFRAGLDVAGGRVGVLLHVLDPVFLSGHDAHFRVLLLGNHAVFVDDELLVLFGLANPGADDEILLVLLVHDDGAQTVIVRPLLNRILVQNVDFPRVVLLHRGDAVHQQVRSGNHVEVRLRRRETPGRLPFRLFQKQRSLVLSVHLYALDAVTQTLSGPAHHDSDPLREQHVSEDLLVGQKTLLDRGLKSVPAFRDVPHHESGVGVVLDFYLVGQEQPLDRDGLHARNVAELHFEHDFLGGVGCR